MDSKKVGYQELIKWKCREHPKVPSEFICLEGGSKDRVVCFHCVQKHSIPLTNLISMSCVLAANEHDIFEAYPPLNDQELFEKLKNARLQQQLEEMEVYFKKLREDIEKEIQAAEQRAKEIFIKQEKANQELLDGYIRIAEVEQLKKLIISEKESAEKDLDDFIKDKWRKAEENKKIIEDLISKYETVQYFSLDSPKRITQNIIESLSSIDFFEQQISSKVNLIKSTYGSSRSMEIKKLDNQIYQIKNSSSNGYHDQVFLDPILNPWQKYILDIEFQTGQAYGSNQFIFGLVKDEGKDNANGQDQKMCYCDYVNDQNNNGITKIIKGNPMQSWTKITGKNNFEVRIHLNEQFLRVASLPDYSSILELNDPNKIDPRIAYRFFLSMCQGGKIQIKNIRTVSNFDRKM